MVNEASDEKREREERAAKGDCKEGEEKPRSPLSFDALSLKIPSF